MPSTEQWCNHDTAAIDPDGICECGAQVHSFPTQDELAQFLVTEFEFSPDGALALASRLERDGYSQTVPVGVLGRSVDLRTLAYVGGWYLLLPYRSPEAEVRR